MDLDDKLIARFWAKVDKNGPIPEHCPELGPCWIWMGKGDKDGYGRVRIGPRKNNVKIRVHRLAILISGREIPEGMQGLHRCDRPKCVRDSHLFVGSNQDNMDDKKAKGRAPSGSDSPATKHPERMARGETFARSKLTNEAIAGIPARRAAKEKWADIAKDLGVSTSTLFCAIGGKTWNHLGVRIPGRGGVARGEKQGLAVLTTEKVIEIRRRRQSGETLRAIAESVGTNVANAWAVVHRKSWMHVP